MKVLCSKGPANHTGPESCVRKRREAHHEALTGVRVGQQLSRESEYVLGAHAVTEVEGNTDGCASASARLPWRGLRPWHAHKLLAREPGDLQLDRRRPYGLAARIGKARSRSR